MADLTVEATTRIGRELGRQLALLRRAAGLTQQELAALVGYARGTVSSAEAGRFDQSRDFWEQCDGCLAAGGHLVATFDELKRRDSSIRGKPARPRRLAPVAEPPCTGDPDVSTASIHIWLTTAEGMTHCLHVPRTAAAPELLAKALSRILAR